jgi:cation-transporting P-type ATPase D
LLLLLLFAGSTDYLVDCLALHDCLGLLRPLLADPAVLKVLHGGANDVLWLQRDAHLYLVNVFDTEKAALVSFVVVGCLHIATSWAI